MFHKKGSRRGEEGSSLLPCVVLACFSLLRSAVTCLRGSRSSYHRHNLTDPSIDLACSESRLEPDHE